MQTLHIRFLEAIRAYLKSKTVHWDDISSQQWQELFRLANAHHVLPMFFQAVYNCPAISSADPTLIGSLRHQVYQTVGQQMTKTADFLRVYSALYQAGSNPLVVKGIICRSLYPDPDLRSSSDEDVLINSREYWLCKMALAEQNMYPSEAPDNGYEVPFKQKDGLLYIELHKNLFPPDSEAYGDMNALFAQVHARAVAVTIQGHTIRTLCPTDHILYLICHALKHFLHSGFGIRQVCDMMLYANAFGSQIDWLYVLECCKSIRAEHFAAALFRIGQEYLTFDPDESMFPEAWRQIETDPTALLEELVSAGIYGQADMARLHSSNITLDAVAAEKQGKKAKNHLTAALFPPARNLKTRYPWLSQHSWLLPVAWLCRIVQYSSRSRKQDKSNAARILRMGNHRIELMRQYHIIDS